tara:strand:+ start:1262 stop:1567 length:306 start_codon:yes stop_codon:yes gene_type:complete
MLDYPMSNNKRSETMQENTEQENTEIKIPKNFFVTYYADKHKKIITRKGQWYKPDTDIAGKVLISKSGRMRFIYWDLDAEPNKNGNQWRQAINPMRIKEVA